MTTTQKTRTYRGPALLSLGFRPFFLFGSIYAGMLIPLWLGMFTGRITLPILLSPRDWHVHELLFGYVAAIFAGFLLTAIPSWTNRLPIQGARLALLLMFWFAGRIAAFANILGEELSLVLDVVFLVLLAAAAGREIIAGRKWNNLPVVLIIALFATANIAFHVEARVVGSAEYSTRSAIALVVILVCLIGGRIIPSFTRNWLARHAPGPMPAPFSRFDAVCMASSVAGLALWVVRPSGPTVSVVLALTGSFHAFRLSRWAGYRTIEESIVVILHLAYAFVPVGFFLSSLSACGVVAPDAGIHAWTAGVIGTMTIAVMTRVSLGHTGHALRASGWVQLIYLASIVAGVARVAAAIVPISVGASLLTVSGLAWTTAFTGFAVVFAPILCRARKSGEL